MDVRIAPPREFEEMLDKLTDATRPGSPPVFETKQKALMFTGALGRSLGTPIPFDRRGTAIRFEIFQRALDHSFVDALAVAHTKDLRVLGESRTDERIRLFEEYAHAGLKEVQRVCFDQPGDPLLNLMRLTDETRTRGIEVPGLDPRILRDLIS